MLFILLLANITAEYKLLAPVSQVFFYSILVLCIVVFIFNFDDFSLSLKKTPEIKGLILTYLIALLIFQSNFLTSDNVLYTITKIAVFIIIAVSVNSNYNFYLKRIPVFLSYIIVILIAIGWFVNKTGQNGNLIFGFANRNVACTVATAGFAGILFMRKKLRIVDYACMALLFITVLYGGSRNALAILVLIIVVRYGFSFKIIVAGAAFLILIMFILPEIGLESTAFDRVIGTFDGSVALDREEVIEIAKNMIAMRPWTGWGYNYSIPTYLGVNLGAHNGYLATLVNLGYPCGLTVLGIIIIGSIKRLKLYRIGDKAINYYLAILISTLFAANQESYLIGVNQFTTNYFFVAFVVLGMYKYKYHVKFNPKQEYIFLRHK